MLFLFLILIALLEIVLLVKIGFLIGVSNTLIVILLTAIFGFYIIKSQWKFLFSQFSLQLRKKRLPVRNLLYDGLLLLAGVFLFLPGWITDFIGLILLIPFVRSLSSRVLKNIFLKKLNLNRIHIQTYKGMNNEGISQTWMSYGLDLKNSWQKKKQGSERVNENFSSDSKMAGKKPKAFADVIELKSRKKLGKTE